MAWAKRLVLNSAWTWCLLLSSTGCWNVPSARELSSSSAANQQMERMARMKETIEKGEPRTVRSQQPSDPKATLNPPAAVTQTSGNSADAPASRSPHMVRIVAMVGNTPIYESEVREGVAQRVGEIQAVSGSARETKERQVRRQELRRIIERELILDEMFVRINNPKAKGASTVLDELKEASSKEADRRLREFKERTRLKSDDDFRIMLQGQGVTVEGLRRQIERNFMMQTYLRELLQTKVSGINIGEIRDYYDSHPDEFQTSDVIKWQDLFINVNKFPNRTQAKQYADTLVQRARRGEDFMQLVKLFDMGLGSGWGAGEKPGEIRPLEVEPVLLTMKPNEVNIVEIETGFHIIKMVERAFAGRKPFDDQVQLEIRRKLQGNISEREYQRLVETLWRRNQPVIYVAD
jgi:peptidyl-prolyl cis-trans isomerase SurA